MFSDSAHLATTETQSVLIAKRRRYAALARLIYGLARLCCVLHATVWPVLVAVFLVAYAPANQPTAPWALLQLHPARILRVLDGAQRALASLIFVKGAALLPELIVAIGFFFDKINVIWIEEARTVVLTVIA